MAEIQERTHVVILCGGGGTRLWPVSTREKPKQFVSVLEGERTLFEETVERALKLAKKDNIWVITNKNYVDYIYQQFPGVRKDQVIIEPEAKNTAMAHVVSTFFVAKKDPNALVVNFASDHFIPQLDDFVKQLKIALEFLAGSDNILTVGIKPTHPDVNYGYIKQGRKIREIDDWPFYEVEKFREKPDQSTAEKYFKSGKYFWNACLYMWRCDTFLETIQKVAPSFWRAGNEIFSSIGTPRLATSLRKAYDQVESISIDYAVSEKTDNLVLFPANFFWSDVGNWQAVYRLQQKDKLQNVFLGEKNKSWAIDSRGNLIRAHGKRIVVFGVSDMVIIETQHSLLVCPLGRTAEVGEVAKKVQSRK
jgi:mannose-1-phosphate guanylyltransferase